MFWPGTFMSTQGAGPGSEGDSIKISPRAQGPVHVACTYLYTPAVWSAGCVCTLTSTESQQG